MLALVLNQRPEAFLPFGPDEEPAPVIDYHLLRSCLRVGLIDVRDKHLTQRLSDRMIVKPDNAQHKPPTNLGGTG